MKILIQKIATIMQIFLLTTHVANAYQNNKSSSVSIETYLAAATVETINKLETVENYLNWLAPRISDQEMENLKNYLQSIGVSKKQKFPKLKTFKSRVYFNAEDFMEYHKNQITIEGLNFYQQKMSMDTIVKNIVLRIHKPKTTAWLNLLLPRAHASSSALTSALIGLVAGGALGYFTAPSSGVSTSQSTRTGAILGALTGLGGYYLSQSLSSQLGSGSLYCNGSNYVINGSTTQQPVEKALTNSPIQKTEIIEVINSSGQSLITNNVTITSPLNSQELKDLELGNFISRPMQHGPPYFILPTTVPDKFFFIKPKNKNHPPPPSLILPITSLLLCVLMAIATALYWMFSTYKKKSEQALLVLSQIRNGDLKARLKTDGMEELSPIVTSFNTMADEISSLVDSLQSTDSARRHLLQDLAHDLRTPLTSVKSFLDTLKKSSHKLSEQQKEEALNYCVSEVNYFSLLVEDLLFLARISEPKYILANDKVDIKNKINELVSLFKAQNSKIDIVIHDNINEPAPIVIGSQKLIERMLRNIIINAISFAKQKLEIYLTANNHQLLIRFVDDGPGFNEEALTSFGNKKSSRQVIIDTDGPRISIGIGSLIVKEIISIHRGQLAHSNRSDQDHTGAIVDVMLPAYEK